ncbi:hypothetical protein PLESTF_001353900 [Pleodorina starrii]|nr:hypothetical protein PLESTM_000008800 [Pleodorina starrii]GLC73265.1 hypothetical protein PLESTF_001353900 [Pleodorina starrii]
MVDRQGPGRHHLHVRHATARARHRPPCCSGGIAAGQRRRLSTSAVKTNMLPRASTGQKRRNLAPPQPSSSSAASPPPLAPPAPVADSGGVLPLPLRAPACAVGVDTGIRKPCKQYGSALACWVGRWRAPGFKPLVNLLLRRAL